MPVEITIRVVSDTIKGASNLALQAAQGMSDGKFAASGDNAHGGWAYRITNLEAPPVTTTAPVVVPDELVVEAMPAEAEEPPDMSPTMGRRKG